MIYNLKQVSLLSHMAASDKLSLYTNPPELIDWAFAHSVREMLRDCVLHLQACLICVYKIISAIMEQWMAKHSTQHYAGLTIQPAKSTAKVGLELL